MLFARDQPVPEHGHRVYILIAALTQGRQGAGRLFDVLTADCALADTPHSLWQRCTDRAYLRVLIPQVNMSVIRTKVAHDSVQRTPTLSMIYPRALHKDPSTLSLLAILWFEHLYVTKSGVPAKFFTCAAYLCALTRFLRSFF